LNLLDKSKLDSPIFDESTHQAVLKFQTEHQLRLKDGKIGRETKGEMQEIALLVKDEYKIITQNG
jgi:murein L,D-transpeptidase YcbB/YkuD